MKMTRWGLLGMAVVFCMAGLAPAGIRTWDGGGANNNWDTPANWDGDVTAPGANDSLAFGGSLKLTNTNTLPVDTSFAGITFNSGAGAFVLAGAGNRITLGGHVTNNSANLQTLNLPMILDATRTFNTASSGSLTAGGVLSGAGGLTKAGAQTLTLGNNTNTFTGPISIQGGTLKVDALNYVTAGDWYAHAIGSSMGIPGTEADGTISIGSGTFTGTLYRTGSSNEVTDRVIDLAGTTGGAVIDNSGANKTIKFTSDFTASGSGAKTLTLYTTSGGLEIAGKIGDSAGGAVTVVAGGTTAPILSGANTYSGPTIINNNGGLKINSLANLGVPSALGAPVTMENGTIKLGVTTSAKTLFYNGAGSNTTDRVIDLSGTTGGATLDFSGASGFLRFTSDFTASGAGAKTLTFNSGSGAWTNEIAGKIVDSTNGATSLSLVNFGGASAMILSGLSPYTGPTTIGAYGSGGVYINSIKNVNGGPSSLGNPTNGNGTISMGSGGFAGILVYTGSGDTTDRAIDLKGTTGGVSLDQSGSGLLKFTTNFTATGAGSKTLTLTGSTSGTGEVAGAIVDNSPVNRTSLAKNGTGTWILSTTNSFSGTLAVNGGTLVLSGNNSYSGATTISAGSLVLSGHSFATNSVTIGTGGRLELYGTNTFAASRLIMNAGAATNLKASLSLRSDGSAVFAREVYPNGSSFDAVNEFNVDRATPGGSAGGTITWGNVGSNMVFNNDRGQLLVTGDNGYGLTMNPNLSWAGQNQTLLPNIVNNAPGLLTLQGNLIAQNVNNRSFELTGTGDIRVNGNISGGGYYIYKTGAGTVTLAGTNTWVNNGGFTVDGGMLRFLSTAANPSSAAPVKVISGTFDLNGVNLTNTTLTMGGGAAGTVSILASGAGTFTLGNNVTYNGHVANDNGATISNKLSLGAATRTFTVNDSTAAAYDMTVSADISSGGSGGITKAGLGTLRLSGSNSFTGATLINAGTLALDYTDNTNSKIAPGLALTIGSQGFPASLQILGTPPGALSVNGLTISGSSNSLVLAAPTVLNAGSINRSLGADPLAISVSGGGTLVTAAGGTPGGILTNYGGIVIGTYNGIDDWAALDMDGVTITSLSAVGGYTAMGSYVAGRNADITGDVTPPANATFNSLRFNTAASCTLSLSGVNTIPTGGILVTPAAGTNRTTITGGSLRPNSSTGGREFAILQNNPAGDLLLGTILTNNSGNAYVTKSGPGRLVVTANNSVGGSTFLNAGELQYGDGTTTGALTQFGYLYAQSGTVIRVAGTNLVVSTVTGIWPFGNPVIDVAAGCVLENGTMNSGGNGSWVKTGPGTLRQLNSGFTAGWVKEGVFLSDAGANYTLNGGGTVGDTPPEALPALVKVLGSHGIIFGNNGPTIRRTGVVDVNGHEQTLSTTVFTGGGLLTNSGASAKGKSQNITYNAIVSGGETARYLLPMEGSSSRNDFQALQLTVNDDPNLDVELAICGGVSNYPGVGAWGMQKMGSGTLYFGGTNTWGGNAQVLAGILIANKPASLPGFATTNRWPVSAGATLAVSAGGPGEWTAAEIDVLRAVSPSHFAANSWLGIDSTAGEFTYASVIGNGAGALGLRKLGTNRLVLAAANTFTGNTVVHAGTLVASNANALGTSGTITILSNVTFAVGAGITFSRPVTFNPGSALAGQGTFYAIPAWSCPVDFTVAPGLPAGTLTVDRSLALSAGNTLRIAFQPDGSYGKLAVNGALDISEPTARLVLTGTPAPGKHVLAEGTALTGQFQDENVDLTGFTGSARITYTATQVLLNVAAKGTLIWIR